MSERLVLIDSSAWIAHLGGHSGRVSSVVKRLLEPAQRAAINAVIRIEVLTGAIDDAQYVQLEDELRGVKNLMLTEPVWRLAERTRFVLRKRGHLISVPDIVIASCAMVYSCELLHSDHHFEVIARHAPLKIHR